MSRARTSLFSKPALLGALALALAGCGGGATVDATTARSISSGTSGSASGTGANGTTTGSGNTTGNGSATATTGNGVTTTSGNGSGAAGNGSGGTSGDDGGFQACAADSTRAQSLPLDMYIMLDQSGSMGDSVAGGGDKWTAVTGALSSFVNQPGLAGISVGIQYFGLPPGGSSGGSCPATCGNSTDRASCSNGGGYCYQGYCIGCGGGGGGDSCNGADYATPEVEIAPLPGVATAITNSLGQHSPTTDTPTSAALLGAVEHSASWAGSHPGHVVIAVLATDGDPTECDTNLNDIDQIAANGYGSTPSIRTFVIGVGSSLSALNGIAAAGGTNAAFIVDTSQNVNQQFLDALNNIRGTALGCQYTLPVPDAGTINTNQVNVQYTPGSGGAAETIPNVASAGACPASGDAWYYDNPGAPSQIILCPTTCTTVSADSTGQVDILTGCQTIFN